MGQVQNGLSLEDGLMYLVATAVEACHNFNFALLTADDANSSIINELSEKNSWPYGC